MSYLLPHSAISKKKKSANKTEPSSSQKKYLLLKPFTHVKPTITKRQDSPTLSGYAKAVPSNIIYDKQTLYIEVQQLKKLINKLTRQNTKLKTKISVLQTQSDRLQKIRQHEDSEEGQTHRAYLLGSSGNMKNEARISKVQNFKNQALKKQIKQLQFQLQFEKKENLRIKRSVKYSKINELQIQVKTFIQENKYLYGMYEQLKSKLKLETDELAQSGDLQNKLKKLNKQNKSYINQIENLNIEIMNLQSELRKEKAQKSSKESSIKNGFSEDKRSAVIKLKEMIEFKRENSITDSKIRTLRAKEKLQQTSFKTHHVHIQPIRKNPFFLDHLSHKLDQKRESSLQLQQKSKVELMNENQKLKSELSLTQRKLKQVQEKAAKIERNNRIQSKTSAVPTFFSENMEKEQIVKQRIGFKQEAIQQGNESPGTEFQITNSKQKNPNFQITVVKVDGNMQNTKSQQNFAEKSQNQEQTQKTKTQYLKQKINLDKLAKNDDATKKILKEIREILTYRFMYQKYHFTDLKKDIESSNAKQFNYIDVCHMLVNEPFYLNLDYCRTLTSYIFGSQKAKHEQTVETSQLLIKLRKVVIDYKQMAVQNQFRLLQKCGKLVKKHRKALIEHFQLYKNDQNTIEMSKLREILTKFTFETQDIDYIIAQVSISSIDLHHIPCELILERFSILQSAKSSKQDIIFEEQNSNVNNSQNSLASRSFQNIQGKQIQKAETKQTKQINQSKVINKSREEVKDEEAVQEGQNEKIQLNFGLQGFQALQI